MPGLVDMHPKVGIRPTIDGRLRDEVSVKETEAWAQAAAEFIRQNVTYTDGEPVGVLVSHVIGNAEEAARAASHFSRNDVGVEITATDKWCYGTETVSMDPVTQKALLPKNGTERPGRSRLPRLQHTGAVVQAHPALRW